MKTYSVPRTEVRNIRVRMSILVGSIDTGVFNGTSGGTTTGKGFTFEAMERQAFGSID
jgi:hypothetical protein